MKDNIYTIPLTDAMQSGDECPFCFIHKKLETDGINFMLGPAYMADNIREETNKLGFCADHYQLLYDHGNRLGIALMMHTHLNKLLEDLQGLLNNGSVPKSISSKVSFLTKIMGTGSLSNKEHGNNSVSDYIYINNKQCYVCNKIEQDMIRYIDTFFYIWKGDPDFISLVKNCKGFCLSHFAMLLDAAPGKLSKKALAKFHEVIVPLTLENLQRIEQDLSWFIDKFDYRNQSEPWKNSKDAIPRVILKLASRYVQENS